MFSHIIVAVSLLSATYAAPAPQVWKRVNDPLNVSTANLVSPLGASGQLRGSKDLTGYSSSNPVSFESSTQVRRYGFELAPGQSEDEDLGLYLDLASVENSQPILGGKTGPTDPGPRNYAIDRENSDSFAPPGTDTNDVSNAK